MHLPFVEERQSRWIRLEHFLHRAEKNRLSSFSKEDLIEFSVLYRQTATDLALAKSLGLPADLIGFLNDLVSRTYHYIYRAEKTSLKQFRDLVTTDFPALVRQNWRVILISFVLLLTGWAVGFCGYLTGPEVMARFLPPEIVTHVLQGYQQKTWFNDPPAARPYISLYIMQNNIRVAFQSFAGGMLLGTLTCFALLYNGLILGVLAAGFMQKGYLLSFWAMILPHGVIELSAIMLAAAAGFALTRVILFPGVYSRSDAFRIHGVAAVKLLMGTALMLVIAALIEGFFSTISRDVVPEGGRLAVAAATALLLAWYFWPRSRRKRRFRTAPVLLKTNNVPPPSGGYSRD